MNQARICEIVSLLKQADREGTTQSEYNWRASKLIWEEVESGTKQKDLAEQIGKSPAHITRLKKCWQVFVIGPGVEFGSFRDLGSFYEAYNSPEVHGESQRNNERNRGSNGQGRGGQNKRTREDEDFSGHGLVSRAYTALSILSGNPAFWPVLAEEDWVMLQAMPDLLRQVDQGS
jgi:hypothetical protein